MTRRVAGTGYSNILVQGISKLMIPYELPS